MAELCTHIILLHKFMEGMTKWNKIDESNILGFTTVMGLLQDLRSKVDKMSNDEIKNKTEELLMILNTMIQLSNSTSSTLIYVAGQLDMVYTFAKTNS